MKCLHCGYCCIKYAVVIVVDPEKGPVKGNLEWRDGTKPCRHLQGNKPGEYKCKVHHYPWFKETPCGQHTQVELSRKDVCRMGEYILKNWRDYANPSV